MRGISQKDLPRDLEPYIKAILEKDPKGKRQKWLVGHEDWIEEIPLSENYDYLSKREQHVIRVYWILEMLDIYNLQCRTHHRMPDRWRNGLIARSMAHVLYWVSSAAQELGPIKGIRKFLEWCAEERSGYHWRWTTLSLLVEEWATGRRRNTAWRKVVMDEKERMREELVRKEKERKEKWMDERWPKPTEPEPELEQLEEWTFDGVAEATDGCPIEPDGVCVHGHPSWLLKLGFV